MINRRLLFRKLVQWADEVNIWLSRFTRLNVKRMVLEAKQDLVTMEELDRTIGKSLGIK